MKDTRAIKQYTSDYTQLSEQAKQMAIARRSKSPYKIEFIPVLIQRLQTYLDDCEKRGESLTMGGFILASGVPSRTWYDMKDGMYDSIVEEYRICYGLDFDTENAITPEGEIIPLVPYSQIIENYAILPLQIQLEKNCYDTKARNASGSIFALKARYNWQEDNTPQTLNQTLVIADGEQARQALEMLK